MDKGAAEQKGVSQSRTDECWPNAVPFRSGVFIASGNAIGILLQQPGGNCVEESHQEEDHKSHEKCLQRAKPLGVF